MLGTLFDQDWGFKPHTGRQRKSWDKIVNDLFEDLKLNKSECIEDMKKVRAP